MSRHIFHQKRADHTGVIVCLQHGREVSAGNIGDLRIAHPLLELAASGKHLRCVPVGKLIISALVACAVVLTVCLILKGRMKSVRAQRSAAVYVAPGGLALTARSDRYSHTTETRTRINDRDHDGGGGAGNGSSGKF